MIGASALPPGVASALQRAGLDCQNVEPSLGGWSPAANDVLLLAQGNYLVAVERRLSQLRGGLGAAQPPIVVLGDPMQLPFGAAAELLVSWVLPMGSADDVARQVLKCIGTTLDRKGASRGPAANRDEFEADSNVQKRLSAEPPMSHSRGPAHRGPNGSPEPRSGFSLSAMDALRFPQPPKLPTVAGQPMAAVTPVPVSQTSGAPGSVVAGAASLMPRDMTVTGSRWLLLDDDVSRAHAIASALERVGARVELSRTVPSPARLAAMRDLDACGVLLSESELSASAGLLEAFSKDSRLRWTRVVPVRWASVFDEATSRVDHESLKLLVLPHWQPEHDVVAALLGGHTVDCSLVGPAKFLRAAASIPAPAELTVTDQAHTWQVLLCRGELHAVAFDGRRCAESDCGAALDGLLCATGANFSLRTGVDLTGIRSLGAIDAILKAHAVYGTPQLPARPRWRNWRMFIDSFDRLSSGPLARRVLSRWRSLGPTGRNAVAMAGGMASTGALLVALWPLVTATPVASRTAAKPVAAASTPVASPTAPAAVGARAEPESVDRVATAPEAIPKPAADSPFPSGCGRWINDKQPPLPQPHQAKSAWRMARKAVQVGDMVKAEELLCVSVVMDPAGPGAEGLIRFHFSQNNIDAATNWAQWAYAKHPSDPEVKQLLADVRNRQGRLDEARALLHDAMNVSAADIRVIRQVARKYTNAGYKALRALDPGQGERLFRRAVTLDGNNALAHAGLAEVSLRGGELQIAEKHAATAVRLDATCFEAQLALGDVHAENKHPELAKRAWLEAARLRPTSREARRRLGL